MKILKVSIENFGKLSNFNYDFSDGLNVIYQNNGFGKTTLSVFIKAMFFGLEVTTKQNLNENERKKYKPWQGGNFGGSLEFYFEGNSYRITRYFDVDKVGDTFSLTDLSTGKESNKFSKNVGEEIFEFDANAFERSFLLPQKVLASSNDESLKNKLINIIQGTSDTVKLSDALNAIDKRRQELYKQNKTGLICETEQKLNAVYQEKKRLINSKDSILEYQALIEKEEAEIKRIELSQQEVEKKQVIYQKNQKKIAYLDSVKSLENKVQESGEKVKGLSSVFNGKAVTSEDIDSYTLLNSKIQLQKEKLYEKQNDTSKKAFNDLENYFARGGEVPTDITINAIKEINHRYETLIEERGKFNKEVVEVKAKKVSLVNLFLIISLLFLGLSSLLLLVNNIASICCMSIFGLASIILGGISVKNYIQGQISSQINSVTRNNSLGKIDSEIKLLESQMIAFIVKYEPNFTSINLALTNIINNISRYNAFKEIVQEIDNQIIEITNNLNYDIKELNNYLSLFNYPSGELNYNQKLYFLKETYIKLQNEKSTYSKLVLELEKLKKENTFDEKDLDLIEGLTYEDLQNLSRRLDSEKQLHINRRHNYLTILTSLKDNYAKITELEDQESFLSEEKEKYESELKIIKKAKELLSTASENLYSKFLTPTQTSLRKILSLVFDKDIFDIELDVEMNIKIKEQGSYRKIDYFSQGYKDIIDLALRFSIIDVIFKKESSFVILDDPFVNLDDSKLSKVLEFLTEISKDYQVIYLVCNNSRKV